ncbi:MAG: amino acid permease [Rickettsiales bacterium]|jgi:APA family basic amino acid/polyamine antiporter
MSLSKFMVKKSITSIQAESQKGELKRTLSALNLVSLGIGCIIGTGIFVLTGTAAAQHAGPAIVLSFLLAGLCCAFAAMCYAELSSMLPVSGSAYSYAYASLGELFAWVMGWLLLLEYGVAASTVAVGWSGYVVSFLHGFNINIPLQWTAATGQIVKLADGGSITALFNLPAFLAISAVTSLLVIGVKESANVNNIIVFIKLLVVILFIAIGIFYVNPSNWFPFIPDFAPANNDIVGDHDRFGWSGILHGASIVFFAYIGFEAVSTASQEAKNPQRDIPIGILGSLAVCTVLYILVSLVLTGIVKYTALDTPSPIATAVDMIGLPWLSFVIKIGAIAGLSSVMLVLMYGQTRIFYTMAKDGLLPPIFCKIHPKFQTPWINTILVGMISGIVAGTTNINALGNLVNLGTLLAFTIICYTVLHLRKKEPNLTRPFQVPYPKITPILGMLFCAVLISSLWETFVILIPYFALGFAIYFGYGQHHSKLRKK